MMFFLFFQDFIGIWTKIADQGIAIAVLALILFFVIVLVVKILPAWERVRTAESAAMTGQAKALGELASSQSQLAASQGQLAAVVKDIAIEQRQSTEAVKILQRVNASSNEQLASDVQELNKTLQNFSERLDRLENKDVGN